MGPFFFAHLLVSQGENLPHHGPILLSRRPTMTANETTLRQADWDFIVLACKRLAPIPGQAEQLTKARKILAERRATGLKGLVTRLAAIL